MGIINNAGVFKIFNCTRVHMECDIKNQMRILNKVLYSQKSAKDNPEIPRNLLENFYTASQQAKKGIVYDKKPFKVRCVPNKKYHWCSCGYSKSQPFCDGSHKNPYIKVELRPVRFQVEEEKDYYLCNCKQTSHRPFCDGTHKQEEIQAKK